MRLVYLSPVPLDSFAQRPHHFVRWFHARYGARVLWVDPYPTRVPRVSDLRRILGGRGSPLGPEWATADWIERRRPQSLPIEPYRLGRILNRSLQRPLIEELDAFVDDQTWIVAGKPSDFALELFSRHRDATRVYDVMDNFAAFSTGRSARWTRQAEDTLLQRADWAVASSTPLFERLSFLGEKLRCARNALTPEQMPTAKPPEPHTAGKLVFGYVGSIARWFDWDAIDRLAALFPQASVRLVGPLETSPPRVRPNVELLGPIPHARVYPMLAGFTFGLIPFLTDALTECVDPVKYYEYRAMGLPVLSTRFGEMRSRGPADQVIFLDAVSRNTDLAALALAACQEDVVAAFRRDNTWDARFAALDFLPASPGL